MYCTMAFELHFHSRHIMFPFLFCLYNDEPFFSENGAQVLRDLVDAIKT